MPPTSSLPQTAAGSMKSHHEIIARHREVRKPGSSFHCFPSVNSRVCLPCHSKEKYCISVRVQFHSSISNLLPNTGTSPTGSRSASQPLISKTGVLSPASYTRGQMAWAQPDELPSGVIVQLNAAGTKLGHTGGPCLGLKATCCFPFGASQVPKS